MAIDPEEIFDEALVHPPSERGAFLRKACNNDPEMLARLQALLALAERRPDLLAPPAWPAIPERLGHYRIIRECGRGGMGVVLEAQDERLGRTVAIKILPERAMQDPDSAVRLEREARILASLHHESIATLFTFEQAEGFHFITMEFVDGESLATRLAQGPMPPRVVIRIAVALSTALEYAHAKHVVHRDLKPANVMFTNTGAIKVLDFGIAKVVDDDPNAAVDVMPRNAGSALRGTPGYMSPEQLLGWPVDERCDLWALGCIMFECLTGRPVMGSVTTTRYLVAPRTAAHELPRNTPRRLRRLILACISESPNERPKSAARVRAELMALSQGGWAWRRRALVATTAALALWAGTNWLFRERTGDVVWVENLDGATIVGVDSARRTVWKTPLQSNAMVVRGRVTSLACDRTLWSPSQTAIVAVGRSPTNHSTKWHLDKTTGQVLASRPAKFDEPPVNAQGVGEYHDICYVPWGSDSTTAVCATVWDGTWYGCAIQFYTMSDEPLAQYYHPGPIDFLGCLPARMPNETAMLFCGVNSSARFIRELVPFESRQHCACLILLESGQIRGQSFPYSDGLPERRDWPGMERARERGYLVIPPLDEATRPGLMSILRTETGVQWFVSDGRGFDLDQDLRPMSCYVMINTVADRVLANARTTRAVYIHDGVLRWCDVPIRRD